MPDLLLLETGDKVLREDGGRISLIGHLTNTFQNYMAFRSSGVDVGERIASAIAGIGRLPAHTSIALEDLFAAVDDPGGTPVTKKMSGTDLRTLTCSDLAVQVKTVGSGTYTPTSGMRKVLVIGVGGGGGGDAGLATDSAGGGGGGGGTCIRVLSAAQIGVSKAYVVGAKGLGRTSAQASTAGTATTLDAAGALLNAGGGQPGTAGAGFSTVGVSVAGGAGGAASNGDLNIPGKPGERGVIYSGTTGWAGNGGASVFGFGGVGVNAGAGAIGTGYGAGGAAGHAATATDQNGANGTDGILYFLEFI